MTPRQIAVVYNPTALSDRAALGAQLERSGLHATVSWYETTRDEPGAKQTREAVANGADMVLVCGGDGTVADCAGELVGTGIAMALVPVGTGNLLARNLGIPLTVDGALRVAAAGRTVEVDVLEAAGRRFLVLAGLGFDAEMIRHATDSAKSRLGWLAYVMAGVRAMRTTKQLTYRVRIDDGPATEHRGWAVLIGNVGRLQGGVRILPDADPHDGLLDVIVLAPRTWRDIPVLVGRILLRRPDAGRQAHVLQGRTVRIDVAEPTAVEFDGEHAGTCTTLAVSLAPGTVTVCV